MEEGICHDEINSKVIDLSDFKYNNFLASDETELLIVVKSLDQVERRERLIEQLKTGSLGRMKPREVSKGLLLQTKFPKDDIITDENAKKLKTFREPRGIAISDEGFLLTEINRVLELDWGFSIKREFNHNFFSFLHSVDLREDNKKFIVVSSGYDAIIEVNFSNGEISKEWFGWENGFNPDDEGNYLIKDPHDKKILDKYRISNKFIDPHLFNEQGLITSGRTTHPSIACYHPKHFDRVLAVLGKNKSVCEINLNEGSWDTRITGLERMPHGIMPYGKGWMVTNTLKGEFWILDENFKLISIYDFKNLPGKPSTLLDNEWIQGVFPLNKKGQFIAVDANRGLIGFDAESKEYFIQEYDENWCIQEIKSVNF